MAETIEVIGGRSVKEWVGKTLDTDPPPRVKMRVLARFKECCAGCGRKIVSGMWWETDHKKAIINGGENREKNLQPLCGWCHPEKTAKDTAEKSATYKTRLSHFGKKKRKGWPMPGSRASGLKKKMDGTVVRR